MSFAAGSLAGALAMGGIYYGFSNMIQTRTAKHRTDIHNLSERIASAPTTIPSPPPASTRIAHRPLASLVQSKWNEEVAGLFGTIYQWEQRATELGKKVLYGDDP